MALLIAAARRQAAVAAAAQLRARRLLRVAAPRLAAQTAKAQRVTVIN